MYVCVLQEHSLQRAYRQQISALLRDAGLSVGPGSETPDWRYIACVPSMVRKVRSDFYPNLHSILTYKSYPNLSYSILAYK